MLQHFHSTLPTPRNTGSPTRTLLVAAAPAEIRAILRGLNLPESTPVPPWSPIAVRPDMDLLQTGIGKSNAAGATARALDPARHDLVLNVGIAGALPQLHNPASLGSVHIASACVFADEGLETPDSFLDCAAMGFPIADFPGSAVPTTPSLIACLAPLGHVGPIATVSTCSGTNALAQRTAQRTSATIEAMEGAAVALACFRLGVPMTEIRVVSNTTGDRPTQTWAIGPALSTLEGVIRRIFPYLR